MSGRPQPLWKRGLRDTEMLIGPELAHAIQAVGVESHCVHGYNSCCKRYYLTQDHIKALVGLGDPTPLREAPAGHDRPCPKCGGLIDTGDKSDGSRLTCPHCKARPYLHHRLPYGDDCWPECFDLSHWYMDMAKRKKALLK